MSGYEFYGGNVIGPTIFFNVDDAWMSGILDGYKMTDEMLDALVNANVEFVALIDEGRGNYTSTIEDWQDRSVWVNGYNHLRQSMMYGY